MLCHFVDSQVSTYFSFMRFHYFKYIFLDFLMFSYFFLFALLQYLRLYSIFKALISQLCFWCKAQFLIFLKSIRLLSTYQCSIRGIQTRSTIAYAYIQLPIHNMFKYQFFLLNLADMFVFFPSIFHEISVTVYVNPQKQVVHYGQRISLLILVLRFFYVYTCLYRNIPLMKIEIS